MEHRDDPARPEQHDENFATGADHKPDTPEEELEPNFARGLSETDPTKRGRFSTGEEETPDAPENNVERRFSQGIEQSPHSD